MKFSIFIVLFILPSSIFAVSCNFPTDFLEPTPQECPACAFFNCFDNDNDTDVVSSFGCPEDFLFACSNYTEELEFIKNKNLNNIDFKNEYVTYISGCGDDEIDAYNCLNKKVDRFFNESDKYLDSFKPGDILWSDSDQFHYIVNGKEVTINENNSGSNGQVCIYKLIGIFIAIGWILAAAWI